MLLEFDSAIKHGEQYHIRTILRLESGYGFSLQDIYKKVPLGDTSQAIVSIFHATHQGEIISDNPIRIKLILVHEPLLPHSFEILALRQLFIGIEYAAEQFH